MNRKFKTRVQVVGANIANRYRDNVSRFRKVDKKFFSTVNLAGAVTGNPDTGAITLINPGQIATGR